MELWGRLTEFLLTLLDTHDYQAVFLLIFIEEVGIPLPLPGDVVMLLAGYRVGQGQMNLLGVLVLLEVSTLLGTSILYWVAARGGRPLLYRYGRYLHLDRPKLDRAEDFLRRRGAVALVLGRLIPGLRIPTVVTAAVFGTPYPTFLASVAVGAFLYNSVVVLLGLWVGPYALDTITAVRFSLRAVATVVLFVLLAGALILLYRRAARPQDPAAEPEYVPRTETSILAGFLATLGMVFGINALLYLLSAADVFRPEQALFQLLQQAAVRYTGGSVPRLVTLVIVLLVVVHMLWALLYARVAIRYLPGSPWLRGLLFSVLPLAVSAFILLPLLGVGPLGLGLGAGLLPLASEMFRNALFGVSLGALYSLLREARATPIHHLRRRFG